MSPFPWSGNGEDEGLGDEMAETRETTLRLGKDKNS